MLLPLVLSLTLSLVAPVAVQAFGDEDSYGTPGYYAEQQRQHERQMQEFRAEEQAAYYRQQQDAARLNEPTRYEPPSWVNPAPSFGVYGPGNSMQVCTQSGQNVYCF